MPAALLIGLALVSGIPVPLEDSVSGQEPPLARLVADLNRGHLVLEQVRFLPSEALLAPGTEPVLTQTARAITKTEGRFVVVVPPEKNPGFPPDTVLSRRRAEEAFRRLVSAGINLERLVGMLQPPTLQPVEAGMARVELFRIN